MKKLYILFALSLISFFSYGQDDNYCGWEYTVTANNAVIAIQEANFENMTKIHHEQVCFIVGKFWFLSSYIGWSNINVLIICALWYIDSINILILFQWMKN